VVFLCSTYNVIKDFTSKLLLDRC